MIKVLQGLGIIIGSVVMAWEATWKDDTLKLDQN